MTETRVWLVRHPEPEAAAIGRCYGSLDVKLSEAGIRRAHAIAESLAGEALSAIYTSPLVRCRRAAEILAVDRTCCCEVVEGLREIDFGELEGLSYDEIAALHPELYRQWMEAPTQVGFPGGESFAEMRARVVAAAADIRSRHGGQTVALVTHGGVIRVLLAEALGMDAGNIFRLGQRYGGISLVRYFGEGVSVELMNAECVRR